MEEGVFAAFVSLFYILCCGIFYFALIAIGIGVSILWIIMLIDLIKRDEDKYESPNERMLWLIVLLLAGWLGIVLYYFMVYKKYGRAF